MTVSPKLPLNKTEVYTAQETPESTAAVSFAAASFAFSASNAVMTGGGMQGFWGVVHQFQFYLLIPLIGPKVPQKILDFLEGIKLSLFNFNFIESKKIVIFDKMENIFEWEKEREYLFSIGIESKCGILNNMKMFFVQFVVILVHTVYFLIIHYGKCKNSESKIAVPFKYIFRILTFTYYIRFLIEAFLILSLGSLNEIYNWDFGSIDKVISYFISAVVILLLLSFLGFAISLSKKAAAKDFDPKESYFSEVTTGTKNGLFSRLIVFFHLWRLLCSVSWIIFSNYFSIFIRIFIYCLIQIIFSLIKTLIRPYEETKDNIIEIMNDWLYWSLWTVVLFHYNSDTWKNWVSTAVIMMMTLNSVLIMFVQLASLIILTINYMQRKKKTKIVNDTTQVNINDKSQSQINQKKILSFQRKVSRIQTNMSILEEEKSNGKYGQSDRSISDITPQKVNKY